MLISQFIKQYQHYVSEIEMLTDPVHNDIITELRNYDIKSHYICQDIDQITEYEARGFVWSLFRDKVKSMIR